MATAIKKCRVCGKEYEACHSAKRVDGVFQWKDVACSPECGATYLALIRESRAKKHDAVAIEPVDMAFAIFEQEYQDESEDDMFEDAFDDEAEETEIEV